jgi:hypothetical protein
MVLPHLMPLYIGTLGISKLYSISISAMLRIAKTLNPTNSDSRRRLSAGPSCSNGEALNIGAEYFSRNSDVTYVMSPGGGEVWGGRSDNLFTDRYLSDAQQATPIVLMWTLQNEFACPNKRD